MPFCPTEPQYKRVGCFVDSSGDRAMPTALGNYQVTRNLDAVRMCYLDAKTRGYTIFGVEDKGKCYSGKDVSSTYNKHGSSSACSGGKGGPLAIEVYGKFYLAIFYSTYPKSTCG